MARRGYADRVVGDRVPGVGPILSVTIEGDDIVATRRQEDGRVVAFVAHWGNVWLPKEKQAGTA